MLVISRRLGESILLGNDVEIQIVEMTQSRVKIGIKAPRELTVLRKEVLEASRHNEEASQSSGGEALTRLVTNLRKTP